MKILHYIPTYAPAWKWGGPVRSVSLLCEGLAALGHEVTVITSNAGIDPAVKLTYGKAHIRNGVKVFYMPRISGFGINSPGMVKMVWKIARDYDIVHITAIWQRTGYEAAKAAITAGIPYVISPRGALGPYSWRRGAVKKAIYYFIRERRVLKNAAGFHYTSSMEEAECQRFRFNRPYCTIANGVDVQMWKRQEAEGMEWRQEHKIDPNECVILYAGRIAHKKGLELLPESLRRLKSKQWRMVFVGPEEDLTQKKLLNEFKKYALDDRAIFLDTVGPLELRKVYSASDIFVFPSLHENFGNAPVEAAACGCFVLASNSTGVAAQLASLSVGRELPRDAVVWAKAIDQFIDRGKRGGTCSPRRIQDTFSPIAIAKLLASFYSSLIQRQKIET